MEEHSGASTNNKRDWGEIMNNKAGSKANGNKPASRSIRIEFGRTSAFAVAIVGTVDGQRIFRHSLGLAPFLGARLCEPQRSHGRKIWE
jgi:hypothetical protein